MAVTTIQTNNRGIKFRTQIIREYVRGNMFSPYWGNDGTAVIRTFLEEGKFGGDQINVPLVTALKGSGKGSGTLTGNEEAIGNYGTRLWIDWARNAVTAKKNEIKKGSFDLFAQAAPLLSKWGKSLQRDEIILGFLSLPSESPPANIGSDDGQRVNGILFSAASAAQKNTFADDNADRVLYGAKKSNRVAGDFAASLKNIAAATDKASAKVLRRAKELAEKPAAGNPKIEPLMTDDGYERYVWFVGSNAFRDLEADQEIYTANKDARPREGTKYQGNPIFNDGDLLYHGVIIRKVPEIDAYATIAAAGAGTPGVDVAASFFCGVNALGFVWGQMPEPTKLDETDYQFKKGAGIEMCYGVGKLFFKNATNKLVQWGMVTVYVASPPSE